MPYRRLPNTDAARIKALETAIDIGDRLTPRELAFTISLLYKAKSFLPKYKANLLSYQAKKDRISKETLLLQQYYKKSRMYLNHFIQVAFYSMQRGELPEETMTYFGISASDSLPSIQSYHDLIEWSNRVLEGEMKRTRQGLPPVTNPTAGVVKVHYDHFLEQHRKWEVLQLARERDQKKVKQDRITANKLIAEIWDEVEESFRDLPGEHKRKRASEYGIHYVYRSNELRHLESL